VHELNEDDYDRRIEFCETFLSLLDEEPDLVNYIIRSRGLIGPFYFEETVNGLSYLSMLNDYFYPIFRRLSNQQSIFLMQDGTSPHYALDVREWLHQKFPARWISRRGLIDWPARSPDLTSADFFL
jgi:hypothetical protein